MKETADTVIMFDKRSSESFAARELKGSPAVFGFSSSFSAENEYGESERIDSATADDAANFSLNFRYWTLYTQTQSTNNFENSYFKEIVNMGTAAVPFIYEELQKGPSQLVHALDPIFPGVVTYNGFVSLEKATNIWLSILKKIGKY